MSRTGISSGRALFMLRYLKDMGGGAGPSASTTPTSTTAIAMPKRSFDCREYCRPPTPTEFRAVLDTVEKQRQKRAKRPPVSPVFARIP